MAHSATSGGDGRRVRPTTGDSSWFVRDRFGMFIHWGLYALPARHEWVKTHEKIDDDNYQRYFEHFDPDLYDPRLWAKAAADAGMKYMVVTTKHHEGFCLWDSQLTTYKAPNTPAGRDLLRPMVEAFREEQLRVGLYHSLIDWHHQDFPIDWIHPMRDHPDAVEWNKSRDMARYRRYLHGQVEELLSQYGDIDLMWFDFSYADGEDTTGRGFRGKGRADWGSAELVRNVRRLQPDILLNDRLDLPGSGDIVTPEQYQPQRWPTVDGTPVVWEACQTFSGSWGYHRDETSWKSPEQLIQMLVNTVSLGGNLLMNVGPTGRGDLDERALAALEVYGRWMRRHGRAIYGCTASDFSPPADCRYTQNGNRLYLHILTWPFRHIHLPNMAGKIRYAQLLNDASEIRFTEYAHRPTANTTTVAAEPGSVVLELPVKKPNVVVPVVELFLT